MQMDIEHLFSIRDALEELEETQAELEKIEGMDDARREACLTYVSRSVKILQKIVREYLE